MSETSFCEAELAVFISECPIMQLPGVVIFLSARNIEIEKEGFYKISISTILEKLD